MRGLIRPAMFWVARFGVVLAVIAWIFGAIGGGAWRFRLFSRRLEFAIQYAGVELRQYDGSKFGTIQPDWSLTLPHWIVVVIIVVFNLALKFVYRRTPEEGDRDA